MAADIKDLLKVCDIKRPSDCRDALTLLTGLLCGMRQAEVATLDWLREGPRANGRKGYMRPCRGGYEVVLLSSKTSQQKAHTFTITNRDAPSLLRKWLDAWIGHTKIEPGTPLLRGVNRWQHISAMRLRPPAICDMIRRRMHRLLMARGMKPDEAYLEAQRFSGHSMRAGMVSETTDRGVPLWKVKARSRHKSTDILLDYVRIAEDRRDSAVKGLKL
jgi:integrase